MNILKEAESIIYGDREQTYGKPSVNLDRIGGQWSLYLKQKFGVDVELTAEDVCWMMVDLKKCRQMNANKRDNLVDAAGYLALVERSADEAAVAPAQTATEVQAENAKWAERVNDLHLQDLNDIVEPFTKRLERMCSERLAGPPRFGFTPTGAVPERTAACNYFRAVEFNEHLCGYCGFHKSWHRVDSTTQTRNPGGTIKYKPFPAPLYKPETT